MIVVVEKGYAILYIYIMREESRLEWMEEGRDERQRLTFSAQLFESVPVGSSVLPACPQSAPNVTLTVA